MKKFIKESLRANLLNEGRLKLLPEDVEFLNSLVPKYIEIFKNGDLGEFKNGKKVHVAEYKYKLASGEDAVVNFWALYSNCNCKGYFQSNDRQNLTDQVIALNFDYFSPSFNFILSKIFKTVTGKDGKEEIRETLYHEMIHAKDPARNNHYLNEPYDSSKAETYYSTWAEFATMTGQFMEAILNKVNNKLTDLLHDKNLTKEKYDKEIINMGNILQNILDFYSGQKSLSNQTKYFIEDDKGNGMQTFMRKVMQFGEAILGDVVPYQLSKFTASLEMIKKYNPEGWKEFHKDLYLTVQECVDKINNATPGIYFTIVKNTTPMFADGQHFTKAEYEQVLPRYNEKVRKKTIELVKTAPKISAGGTGSLQKMQDKADNRYF